MGRWERRVFAVLHGRRNVDSRGIVSRKRFENQRTALGQPLRPIFVHRRSPYPRPRRLAQEEGRRTRVNNKPFFSRRVTKRSNLYYMYTALELIELLQNNNHTINH